MCPTPVHTYFSGWSGPHIFLGKAVPTLTWCDFRYQGPMTLVGSGRPLNNYICESKVKAVERILMEWYRWCYGSFENGDGYHLK